MNWSVFVLAFALSVLVGGWLGARLRKRRADWARRRRIFIAAIPLPGLILLAAAAGILWELAGPRGPGEDMRGLAVAVYLVLGAWFGLLTLLGGLIGAALVERGTK